MTPEELRLIVETWGGVGKFAALIHVRPRTVHHWLAGTRKVRPMAEEFIRSLSSPGPSA